MRYVKLGNSDIKVSAMGLGCMGITHAYGAPSVSYTHLDVYKRQIVYITRSLHFAAAHFS